MVFPDSRDTERCLPALLQPFLRVRMKPCCKVRNTAASPKEIPVQKAAPEGEGGGFDLF